jgi:hypothetical protein
MRRFRRRATHAEGSFGWRRLGGVVSFYLNTTNLDLSRFYSVTLWFWHFRVHLIFDGIHWPEDTFHEAFDKATGKVRDLRVEDPELAKKMDPYRHERRLQWSIMGPFPRKYRSLTVTHSWKIDL